MWNGFRGASRSGEKNVCVSQSDRRRRFEELRPSAGETLRPRGRSALELTEIIRSLHRLGSLTPAVIVPVSDLIADGRFYFSSIVAGGSTASMSITRITPTVSTANSVAFRLAEALGTVPRKVTIPSSRTSSSMSARVKVLSQ